MRLLVAFVALSVVDSLVQVYQRRRGAENMILNVVDEGEDKYFYSRRSGSCRTCRRRRCPSQTFDSFRRCERNCQDDGRKEMGCRCRRGRCRRCQFADDFGCGFRRPVQCKRKGEGNKRKYRCDRFECRRCVRADCGCCFDSPRDCVCRCNDF